MIKEMIINNTQVNGDIAYIEYTNKGNVYYRMVSIGQSISFGLMTLHKFPENPKSTILSDTIDYESNTVKDNDLFIKYIDHISRDKNFHANTLN